MNNNEYVSSGLCSQFHADIRGAVNIVNTKLTILVAKVCNLFEVKPELGQGLALLLQFINRIRVYSSP
jgi:hypothetical protein